MAPSPAGPAASRLVWSSNSAVLEKKKKNVLSHTGVWQPETRNGGQRFIVILKGPGLVSLSKQRDERIQGKLL